MLDSGVPQHSNYSQGDSYSQNNFSPEDNLTRASTFSEGDPLYGNLWTSICLRPRKTIQKIIEIDPTYQFFLLVALIGMGHTLSNAHEKHLGDTYSLGPIIFAALFVGPISEIITFYIGGFILSWSGKLIEGKATPQETRAALAWSHIPYILASALWMPAILIIGEEMFTKATPLMDASLSKQNIFFIFNLIQVIAVFWSFILTCKCLGQVHGFSAWHGFATMFIPGIVVVLVIVGYVGAENTLALFWR